MNKQLKSFLCAFKGIGYTILNESHLRFHIVAMAFVIAFGILFSLTAIEWAVLCLVFSLVMALELLKIAKDVSAGAVLISAIGSIFVACFIFIKPQKIIQVYNLFISNPVYIVLLLLAIVLSLLFIFKFHTKKANNKN